MFTPIKEDRAVTSYSCVDDTGIVVTYETANDEKKSDQQQCTEDLWALGASCVGFFAFGITELIYAYISNSLCLLVDSTNSMVDGTLYCMSFFIEMYRVSNRKNQLPYSFLLFSQVYFPLFATLVLVAFMINAVVESVPVLIDPNSKPPVDIMYVFLFGSLNLMIDFFVAFFYLHDFIGIPCFQRIVLEDKANRSRISTPMTPLVAEKPNKIEVEDRNYIMVSAVIHLVADALNAFLELGSAFLTYYGHYNANFCDALVAVISAVIIVVVCAWFLYDISCAYQRLESSKDQLLIGEKKEESYADT